MKYYAHYGHKDFILCLGHGGHKIKEFFLHYDEWATNDFVLVGRRQADRAARHRHRGLADHVRRHRRESATSASACGASSRHLGDDEVFLANYADGLSDLPLDQYVDDFVERDRIAWFLSVPVPHTFHIVHTDDDGDVTGLEPVATSRCGSTPGSSCSAARSSTT